jgi:hypothetical protein
MPDTLVKVEVERHLINTNKKRASKWGVNAPWPTKSYFTKGVPKQLRFATKGDLVYCVILTRRFYNCDGLDYIRESIKTADMIFV